MKLRISLIMLVLALFCMSPKTFAQYTNYCQPYTEPSLCQMYRAGYDANVRWPADFIPPARRPIGDVYDKMIHNGWRRQNLLGDYHFTPDSNELTEAGKHKVQWILTQAPPSRRNIYIQRSRTVEDTATRIAAVQQWSSYSSPAAEYVNVSDTHIRAEGQSATSVDSIFTGFHANRPLPVLPADAGAGGGGGDSQ